MNDWKLAILTALVLVCSMPVTPDLSACNRQNAADVILVPAGFAHPATCLMHGQAYLAASALADNLIAGDRLKVVCVRSGSAAGLGAAPTVVR